MNRRLLHRPKGYVGITAVLLGVFLTISTQGKADILTTKHNLSVSGSGTVKAISEERVCIFCHMAHHAGPELPLWSRDMSAALYAPYASQTLVAAPGQPTGGSRLCLSCHDGSVALDSYGGSPTTNTVFIPESHRVGFGGDLSGEHPIGFTFTETIAADDGQLHNPTNSAVAELLFSGDLECASCHDVHNDLGVTGLLRVDNSGSGLCLTCHDK